MALSVIGKRKWNDSKFEGDVKIESYTCPDGRGFTTYNDVRGRGIIFPLTLYHQNPSNINPPSIPPQMHKTTNPLLLCNLRLQENKLSPQQL